ncbi:hypothetical protein H633G_10896 [Metarhizium anisopliae BRIP 53284]|nr:hypothetical protein H633G_10896 [Metarhizium anisopliae BRIP 53284]
MGDAPEFDDIRVVHINAGNDEGADITIEINSKRITVSLFASSSWQDEGNSQLGTPIEDQLIQLLNQATIDGKVAIFQINPDEAISLPDAAPDPRFPTVFQPDSLLPLYSSKAIFVEHVFVSGNGTVSQVQVDGQTMLCKARRTGLQDPGLELELMNLQKIWKYNLSSDSTIRVPKLRGYVKHAYSGAIIGLLRDWVPSGSHGNTLRDIDVCAVSPDLRRRWAAQIRQTVSRLHAIGVIWGDGKASNVIVDKYDDVWLIDLAGGWSRGWVDEELADTEEGDDQAVARIVKFLDL